VSFQIDGADGEKAFKNASEALAAWSPDVTGIWIISPNTLDADQSITHAELRVLAEQEATANEAEEIP
jgi:hypothetical protein